MEIGPFAALGFAVFTTFLLLGLLHLGERFALHHVVGGAGKGEARTLGRDLRDDNPARRVLRIGQLLGVSIVATSAVRSSAEGDRLGPDVLWVGGFALLGFVLLVLVAEVGIRLLLRHGMGAEIHRGNVAAGIAGAAHYVAASLVTSRAIGGHGFEDVTISLAFFAAAQLALHLFLALFRALTTYDDAEQVRGENRAAAISYAGALIAMALIVAQAVEGDFVSWLVSFRSFGSALAAIVLLYPVRQLVVQVVLLHAPFTFRGGRLDRSVGVERSQTMAALEAVAYLATALAVVRLRS